MFRARIRSIDRKRPLSFTSPSSRVHRLVESLESRTLFSAGSIDTSFGDNGELSVAFPGGQSITVVRDSLVQPDGKIVVVGQAIEQAGDVSTDFAIARLNADASPDLTFNGTGIYLYPSPGNDDDGTGVALQSDGKIVISGTLAETRDDQVNYRLFVAARFLTDGTVDPTFGDLQGSTVVNFTTTGINAQEGSATDVLISADDKITLVGYAEPDPTVSQTGIALARLNPDGSLDSTFGFGGRVLQTIFGDSELGYSGAFDAAGNIVVTGLAIGTNATPATRFITARFLPTGDVDTSFGTNGGVESQFVGPADAAALAAGDAVAIQPDGKIVVGGFAAHADVNGDITGFNIALLRYNPNGTPDRRFGVGGQIEENLGQVTSINKLLIDDQGRIIASGLAAPTADDANALRFNPFVAQFTPRGQLDQTFGAGGAVIIGSNSGIGSDNSDTSQTPGITRPLTMHAAAAAVGVVTPAAADDASEPTQQIADVLRKQSAIVIALNGRLLIVTTANDELTATQLIGNGADLRADSVTGITVLSVVGGDKGAIAVSATNAGNQTLAGTVTVNLILSTDTAVDGADAAVINVPLRANIKAGRAKALKVKFNFPTSLPDGPYYVLAVLDAGPADVNAANNTGASAAPVTVAAPFVNLGGTIVPPASSLPIGKKSKLALSLHNPGNVPAKGPVGVTVYASADATRDDADQIIAGPSPVNISLKPSGTKTINVPILIPADLPAAGYFLIAVIDDPAFPEKDVLDNTLVTAAAVSVG